MTGASIGNSNIHNSFLEVSLMEMRLDPASSAPCFMGLGQVQARAQVAWDASPSGAHRHSHSRSKTRFACLNGEISIWPFMPGIFSTGSVLFAFSSLPSVCCKVQHIYRLAGRPDLGLDAQIDPPGVSP